MFARASRGIGALAVAASLLVSSATAASPPPASADPHGAAPAGHGEGAGAHGGGHHFNWLDGLLGEQGSGLCGLIGQEVGQPPNALCRAPGAPVPFAALLINAGLLFWLFWVAGRRPLREGLLRRRTTIRKSMDEAAAMREEAEARLLDYQHRLQCIDEEVERVRREMRAAGEAEQARILAEAREKSERMQRDARLVLEQELKAARETLRAEVIRSAAESARQLLTQQVTTADQQRLGEEYLKTINRAAVSSGGSA